MTSPLSFPGNCPSESPWLPVAESPVVTAAVLSTRPCHYCTIVDRQCILQSRDINWDSALMHKGHMRGQRDTSWPEHQQSSSDMSWAGLLDESHPIPSKCHLDASVSPARPVVDALARWQGPRCPVYSPPPHSSRSISILPSRSGANKNINKAACNLISIDDRLG
jgi:hypothetical protein